MSILTYVRNGSDVSIGIHHWEYIPVYFIDKGLLLIVQKIFLVVVDKLRYEIAGDKAEDISLDVEVFIVDLLFFMRSEFMQIRLCSRLRI